MCYYFDDIIKDVDIYFSDILLDEKLYESISVYDILYKTSTSPKPDMIRTCVRDMIRTYSQMHHTDKYSQHIPIIWPVWLNG